jgi:protein-tyrosine phosphatase
MHDRQCMRTRARQVIDLHCHYLPGIDDGARTIEEALTLARAAVAAGIHTSVLTPHVHVGRYDNTLASIRKSFAAFQQVLATQGIPLNVRVGGEVRIAAEIMPLVEQEQIPFIGQLGDDRVMLLEFPHSHLLVGGEKLIRWLLDRRIRPLIAHPERNRDVMRNVDKIAEYVAMGCLLQVTGASIIGQFGENARACAYALLDRNWVNVVATDAHNMQHRPPNLDLAHEALAAMGGVQYARELTELFPARIIGGDSKALAGRAVG